MPELSRSQLAVYAALAVAALMLGARWIDSGGSGSAAASQFPQAAEGEAPEAGDEDASFAVTGDDLVVHVAGAVSKPGVYRMPAGSRVTDAIDRAGGTTGEAAADAINLAAPLADGQQIQVPSRAAAGATSATGSAEGPISLSSATVEDLETIDGIGPVTAESIVSARAEGAVATIDDLDQVSGIGPVTMEALRASLQP